MIGHAVIKSTKLEKNTLLDTDVYAAKARISSDQDIQTIEPMHQPGVQHRPPTESHGFFTALSEAKKLFFSIWDGVPKQVLNEGERISYSYDGPTIKTFIKYLKTGILHINGSTDYAVRFTELETAFNELKTQYNAHNHGGSGTSAPSVADISTAKVDTVKLPGVTP